MIYTGIVVVGYFIVGKFILWAMCRQKNKALQKNYINILSVIIVPFWPLFIPVFIYIWVESKKEKGEKNEK
jgi:cytochrome bd-type quinol oxidase subunit 2